MDQPDTVCIPPDRLHPGWSRTDPMLWNKIYPDEKGTQ